MVLLLSVAVLLLVGAPIARGQGCAGGSCFPSTGDLLVGRGHMLHASSTCGRNREEPYCIVSHLKDIQKCFTCDASDPAKAHEIQNVITTFNNRLETWWQSENGKQQVSVRFDLEAEFQFTHMIMTYKTFRPAAMLVERSMDFGKTWAIYRYFAYDCDRSFPGIQQWPPREIDDVICDGRYSQIEPSNGGEVIYRVLEPFIEIDDPYAPKIQNLLKITNLRINFTELHTLGDDLLDSRAGIKNKYYYALYELVLRGNCFCYGHADECTPINGTKHASRDVSNVMEVKSQNEVHGRCQCQHNTIGLNCEQCKPFHHDQPWRPAEAGLPNECKPCNCNNHATECHFDAAVYEATGQVSGGVCDNCQHNTVGRNCELCAPYYFKDPNKDIRDPTVCAECDCEVAGTLDGGICDDRDDASLGMIAGQCRCKANVEGARCDRCKAGYYGLSADNPDGCTACDCDSLGTLSGANTCDATTGQCICKRFTTGRRCDQCLPQTWGMSAAAQGCNECDCDLGGAYDNDCSSLSGQCNCRPNIESRRCDVVTSGNFLPGLDHYVFEAEEGELGPNVYPDKREYTPPVTWTGDGYVIVPEEGVIVFIVKGLPMSMDYDLVLRYQSNMPNAWQYVDVTIDRPNQGSIPTSSPCGNTRPDDDRWSVALPGPPTTHSSLGIICLERDFTYRVIVDMRRYQRERVPGTTPDILIDSLVVVPVFSNLDMFHGTVEGRQRERQFDELECQNEEMYVPDREPHEECAGLLFSGSSIVHNGAKSCDCDLQGSLSTICEAWGGQCRCKPNVIGRRCDRCAPGTYGFGPTGCRACDCDARGSSDKFCNPVSGQCTCLPGVFGRRCDQCQAGHYGFPNCPRCICNGHADTCDQATGVCLGCRDHTVGDHCDICLSGYYGNPLLGNDDQCKPCMCPDGPESPRQFASGCRQNPISGQVNCFCLPGYTGDKCDRCAPAYWGNPHMYNGLCRECQCNGNVDPSDPNACDASTGVCTACLYDTAGPHCENCKEYYYGSAFARTCTACACNILGTDPSSCVDDQCQCDVTTGQCPCLPNVAGRNCDQCEPNHWKLASGSGCEPCDCNLANSQGASCNEFTGQCQCNEGFGGRTCNFCADGHYGNPDIECFGRTTDVPSDPTLSGGTTSQPPSSTSQAATTSTLQAVTTSTLQAATTSTSQAATTSTLCESRGDRGCGDSMPQISTTAATSTSIATPSLASSSVQSHPTTQASTTSSTLGVPDQSTSVAMACDCDPAGSKSLQCNPVNGQCECREGVAGVRCNRCKRGYTGKVPYCQPCGECFDNWDVTIVELVERSRKAIDSVKSIQETGIKGIYDKEFDQLELELQANEPPATPDTTEFTNMLKMIEANITAHQQLLAELETSMDEIRRDNDLTNKNMTELDVLAKMVETQLADLRSQKHNISQVSPVAAFKQVQESAAASANAEQEARAATNGTGSLVGQSKEIRDEVGQIFDEKKMEFDDKLSQVDTDLETRQADVDALTLSQLNKDVCGKATEGCDESCGGAGCDTCGGIGCNGAVQFSNDAKDRAQKTQETLSRISSETGDLRSRVQTAKANAQQAKTAAQSAKDSALAVESTVRKQNSKIRQLIQDIRDFLEIGHADPKDIETLANRVLDLSLPVTRDEIDVLANSIRDLVSGLPQVDEILNATDADLKRATQLMNDANQAKASADAVASDAQAVVAALDQAENASNLAESAKNQAENDITQAEENIAQIKTATVEIRNRMSAISTRLTDFDTRLKAVERQMADAALNLEGAKSTADDARAQAQAITDDLQGRSALIDQATSVINEKKNRTDRLTTLRTNAQDLAASVKQNLDRLNTISTQFTDYERQLNAKNLRLEELLREVETLYKSIQDKEEFLRTCS